MLGAFGLTEPAAGSNPADMRTIATRENGGWRIRGNKHYITNAKEADFIVLYAKTNPEAGARGISAFMIPKGTEGVEFSSPEKTMGLRGSTIYELALNCWLPESALLGEENKGFHTAMEVLDKGRVEVAATSLGIARAAMECALNWVKERQIGKAISGLPRNTMATCRYAYSIRSRAYVDMACCGVSRFRRTF